MSEFYDYGKLKGKLVDLPLIYTDSDSVMYMGSQAMVYRIIYLPTGDLSCETHSRKDALEFLEAANAEEPGCYKLNIDVE